MRFVDAHCHLDQYPDPKAVAGGCEESQTYTIAVTNLPRAFPNTQRLAGDRQFVRAAVGLHPELVAQQSDAVHDLLTLIEETKYVGEVGLDYTKADAETRRLQREVLGRVFERCEALGGKVITIHSRRAADDVLDLATSLRRSTVILHWFSGSAKALARGVAMGCFFSVNPAMMRSATGRSVIAAVPEDQLLTETDGPFVQHTGRPMYPFEMTSFLPTLAELRGVTTAALRLRILRNFARAVTLEDNAR
ncbi:MAG TPA: Qat anti-phage system TatD family nuclease QatD [Thermoanaerobaculia bacterium]